MISRKFFTSLFLLLTIATIALPMEELKQKDQEPWDPMDDLAGTPTLLHRSLNGHTNWVNVLKPITLYGKLYYVVSGSSDTTLRIWNTETYECFCILRGHTGPVVSLCCVETDDDILIVSGGGKTVFNSDADDFSIRVWSFKTGQCMGVLEGHSDSVTDISKVSKDVIASCSSDGTIRVWNLKTMECIQELGTEAMRKCSRLVTLDDCTLGCLCDDHVVFIWSLTSGICTCRFSTNNRVLLPLSDHKLLSAGFECEIWNWQTGELEGSFIKYPDDPASWGIQAIQAYGSNQIILLKINGNFWRYNYVTGDEKDACDVGLFGVKTFAIAGDKIFYANFGMGDNSTILRVSPNPFH